METGDGTFDSKELDILRSILFYVKKNITRYFKQEHKNFLSNQPKKTKLNLSCISSCSWQHEIVQKRNKIIGSLLLIIMVNLRITKK